MNIHSRQMKICIGNTGKEKEILLKIFGIIPNEKE